MPSFANRFSYHSFVTTVSVYTNLYEHMHVIN